MAMMRCPYLQKYDDVYNKDLVARFKSIVDVEDKTTEDCKTKLMCLDERITQLLASADILEIPKNDLEAEYVKTELIAKLNSMGMAVNKHLGREDEEVSPEQEANHNLNPKT